MLKFRCLWFVGMLSFLWSFDCQGAPDPPFHLEQISIEQGLSQSTVFCLLRDSHGFLWAGTEDGLNKFDGYDFRVYRSVRGDERSLSDNWISDLLEDRRSRLWIVTRKGLDLFDRPTGIVTRYALPDSDEQAWEALEDKSGRLWLTTDGGVYRLASPSEQLTRVALPEAEYRAITEGRNGWIWLGTWGEGVVALPPDGGDPIHFRQGQPEADQIRAIHESDSGELWVLGTDGFASLNPETGKFSTVESVLGPGFSSLDESHLTSLLRDSDDRYWVGTRAGGLFLLDLDNSSLSHFTAGASSLPRLANNTVWSLVEDPSGVIWLGTGTGGGLHKLTERRFHNERHDPADPRSLAHDAVWAILEDRRGGLWVGTSGGLSHKAFGRDDFESSYAESAGRIPLTDDRVWALAEDQLGHLWVGTYGSGIVRFEPSSGASTMLDRPDLDSSQIRALEPGRNGSMWIGTNGGGVSVFEGDAAGIRTFRASSTAPSSGPVDDRVWALHESSSGNIWIGTDGGGLSRFDPVSQVFEHFRFDEADPRALGSDRIWSLFEDSQGRLWVGTKDGGLNRFDPACGCFERYTEATHDLSNDTIYGILPGRNDTLWLSTNRGLSNFDPQRERFINFDIRDGLPTNEFNFGAYHRDSQGRLIFGSIRGITTFQGLERLSDFAAPVVITGFTLPSGPALDEPPADNLLRLRRSDDYFSVSFAALDYRSPYSNRYEYRLHGADRDWRQADARQRQAAYSFLPPGTYTFEVRGTNRDGVWSSKTAKAEVVVPAAFWQTRWFWGAVAVSTLVAIFVLQRRRRHRRIRLQRLLLKGREAERSEVADLIHEGPIQSIVAAGHRIPGTANPSFDPLRSDLREAIRELRSICLDLARPPSLHEGLATAVYDHLDGMEERGLPLPEIEVRLDEDSEELLRPADLLVVYRLFQKAFHNVVQHALASRVVIRTERIRNQLLVEIEDNGVGFEVPTRLMDLPGEHYGLLSSLDAVRSIGGRLEIDSLPGKGTRFRAWLPVRASRRRAPYSFRTMGVGLKHFFSRWRKPP